MSEPYLGEIKVVSFNFAPRGWALCNGQTLPINQNQALFSLLGTTYGGNGTTTFQLPNLQGTFPVHFGDGFSQGQSGGQASHTLTVGEIPAHNHVPNCNRALGMVASPTGAVWATDNNGNSPYSTSTDSTMAPNAIGQTGGSQPHANLPPYLVLNFVIALLGIFPSRS